MFKCNKLEKNQEVNALELKICLKDKKLSDWLENYAIECGQSLEQTVLDCIHNERMALLKDYED